MCYGGGDAVSGNGGVGPSWSRTVPPPSCLSVCGNDDGGPASGAGGHAVAGGELTRSCRGGDACPLPGRAGPTFHGYRWNGGYDCGGNGSGVSPPFPPASVDICRAGANVRILCLCPHFFALTQEFIGRPNAGSRAVSALLYSPGRALASLRPKGLGLDNSSAHMKAPGLPGRNYCEV